MQSDKTEGAAAVGTFEGPGDHFVFAVDVHGQQRLNVFAAIEAIVVFVEGREVRYAGEDWMFWIDAMVVAEAFDVFALRAAARRAKKIQLAIDVFGVFRSDAPMQGDERAAAGGE